MDIVIWIGIAVAALISVPAILYVVWPLLQPGPALPLVDDDRLADLLTRKDTLLRALKDLEFDREMGKVSEEDYTRFAARLRRQAIGIMQQIDKVAPESAALDTELEAEIARLRKVQPNASNGVSVAASEVLDAPRAALQAGDTVSNGTGSPDTGSPDTGSHDTVSSREAEPAAQPVPTGRFCTECGQPLGAGHKFCAECGTPAGEVAR